MAGEHTIAGGVQIVACRLRHRAAVSRLFDELRQPFTSGEVAWMLDVRRGVRVALRGQHVVGFYLAVDFGAGDALWLDYMAVSPAARRSGVARALLADVEMRASELGYRQIELSVFDWNEGAIALYQQLGFCRGTEPDVPGKQRMVKSLKVAGRADGPTRLKTFGSKREDGTLARLRRAPTLLAVHWGRRGRGDEPPPQ